MKKDIFKNIIIVILLVVVVFLLSFIVYNKFVDKNLNDNIDKN